MHRNFENKMLYYQLEYGMVKSVLIEMWLILMFFSVSYTIKIILPYNGNTDPNINNANIKPNFSDSAVKLSRINNNF